MKIERQNLTKEIQSLLKDEFVAEITESDDTLTLSFLNGQKFMVAVQEI